MKTTTTEIQRCAAGFIFGPCTPLLVPDPRGAPATPALFRALLNRRAGSGNPATAHAANPSRGMRDIAARMLRSRAPNSPAVARAVSGRVTDESKLAARLMGLEVPGPDRQTASGPANGEARWREKFDDMARRMIERDGAFAVQHQFERGKCPKPLLAAIARRFEALGLDILEPLDHRDPRGKPGWKPSRHETANPNALRANRKAP